MAASPDVSIIVTARAACDTALLEQTITRADAGLRWQLLPAVASPSHGPFAAIRDRLNEATGRYVALLDARCVPRPGWTEAMARAIRDGVPAAFGPVMLDGTARAQAHLPFIVEYAQFEPPVSSALNEIPGNNFLFDRRLLDPAWLERSEFHKTLFVDALRRKGVEPRFVADAAVGFDKAYPLLRYAVRRFSHGRGFAAGRSEGNRILWALGTPVLPLLRLLRIVRATRGKPAARAALWTRTPAVVFAETAWSLGELVGYMTRSAGSPRFLD